MSYKVLARKWRPNDFSEVVGQEHVVQALANSLDKNKIHQAYVLSGTRGVGKTTIARILAKSLNCEEGLGSKPCGKCSACLSISDGSFMDFQEVDAASNRKAEETKQLLETVVHMPSSSRYKVYLLDEVHMLSKHSFNMLLKLLEEPPEHVIFILATTSPESIPPTVLSRCLQFNLKNLTNKQLIDRLTYILEKEKIVFESGAVDQLARSGRGSLRDSLTITDQAIAFCKGDLTSEKVSEMLGTMPSDNVLELVKMVGQRDAKSLLNFLTELGKLSIDYLRLMDLLLECIQLLSFAKVSEDILEETDLNLEGAKKVLTLFSEEDLQLIYQIGLIAKRDMELAPSLSGGFDMALLRMASFIPRELSETKKKVESQHINESLPADEAKHQLEKESKKPVKLSSTPDEQTSSINLFKENWKDVFDKLDLEPGTRQLASHCSFLKTDDTVIYFSMPDEKLNLFNGKHRKQLQDELSNFFQIQCNLFFESGDFSDDSPNRLDEEEKRKELIEAEKDIKNDPTVKSLIDAFGAEVISSSIEPRK